MREQLGLTDISLEWLNQSNLAERKKLGQYMTPEFIRERLLKIVQDIRPIQPEDKILDPGVGTGEFLRSVGLKQSKAALTGWDRNAEVLNYTRRQLAAESLKGSLINDSALDLIREEQNKEVFDFVIGNPPYFQYYPSKEVREEYNQVISGRPNIFSFFFQIGLEALKPKGILAYVVPPSMNNGAYFSALRNYLVSHADLKHLEIVSSSTGANTDSFADANQAAQIIVFCKKEVAAESNDSASPFVWKAPDSEKIIFTDKSRDLNKLFQKGSTLKQLGYKVLTGTIVWNQNKDLLTDSKDQTYLVWADNIKDGALQEKDRSNLDKKQYIDLKSTKKKELIGPAIVVNRVVGSVGKGTLRAALIPDGQKFVAENHINVILEAEESTISFSELYQRLSDPNATDAIRLLTGNSQISATELETLVPV